VFYLLETCKQLNLITFHSSQCYRVRVGGPVIKAKVYHIYISSVLYLAKSS
jgi:hypothetical protein